MADMYITGEVQSGNQQQWMTRNSHFGSWREHPGAWNMVFVGCENAPKTHCGKEGWKTPVTT